MQGEVGSHLRFVLSYNFQSNRTGDLLVKLVGDPKEASSSNASRSLEERAASERCHGGGSLETVCYHELHATVNCHVG